MSGSRKLFLFVDVFPVSDPNDKNCNGVVVNITYDPVFTYSVLPESGKMMLQWFTESSGVMRRCDFVEQES